MIIIQIAHIYNQLANSYITDVLTDKAYKKKQISLYGPNFFRRAEFEQPESRGRIT